MNRRVGSRFVAATAVAVLAVVPLAAAVGSASLSPDQRFVAELKSARKASQIALRQLAPSGITIDKVNRAKSELAKARGHLKSATLAATGAVGASDTDIAASVRSATSFTTLAAADTQKGSYEPARDDIGVALDSMAEALARFGVPLASEFRVVGGYRELANIAGWEEYLGVTAKAPGVSISKVVIGLAGRETANAAEPGGRRAPPPLAITKLAIYTLQEPSGVYTSGWGRIVNGIIVCDLKPAMDANETFAISFGPRVAKGTKFLVKLWSTDGRRSYTVVTTK